MTAELRGFESVVELLDEWQMEEDRKRAELSAAFRRIKLIRQRIQDRTGIQPDSAILVREDRDSR
ncbi:MAG: hypothetical protein AABP62_05870 [Planctomycetota bacterium]